MSRLTLAASVFLGLVQSVSRPQEDVAGRPAARERGPARCERERHAFRMERGPGWSWLLFLFDERDQLVKLGRDPCHLLRGHLQGIGKEV